MDLHLPKFSFSHLVIVTQSKTIEQTIIMHHEPDEAQMSSNVFTPVTKVTI